LTDSDTITESTLGYFSIVSDNSAFDFISLAKIKEENLVSEGPYYSKEYKDYYLNSFSMGISEKRKQLSYGITLKYLRGRLVYHNKLFTDNQLVSDEFIDTSANGFSSDLGLCYKNKNFGYGIALYDVFSKIYWEDYNSESLRRRYTISSDVTSEDLVLNFAISGVLKWKSDPYYHVGLERSLLLKKQIFPVRIGMYSQKFDNAENIFVGFGFGWKFKDNFQMDFSHTTNNMQIDNSKYLLSISVAIN